jgi:hypothetical protein
VGPFLEVRAGRFTARQAKETLVFKVRGEAAGVFFLRGCAFQKRELGDSKFFGELSLMGDEFWTTWSRINAERAFNLKKKAQ